MEDKSSSLKDMPQSKAKRWTAFLLLFSCSVCSLIYSVQDSDLFWHLCIGRWIRSHGEFPQTEHWNYFGLGRPFRAYSWLSEVTFSTIENTFGWTGLFALQAVMAAALASLMAVVLYKQSKSLAFTFIATAFFNFAINPFVVLRPQVVTFIAFAAVPLIVDSIERKGLRPGNLLAIFLVVAVWANNHIAVILELGWLGGWLMGMKRKRVVPITAATLTVAFIASVCTPYGFGVWEIFFSKIGHVGRFRSYIVEFAPLSMTNPFFLFWAACACVCFVLFIKGDAPFFRKAITFSFLTLGLYAVKFIPFALMASLVFIAGSGSEVLGTQVRRVLLRIHFVLRMIPSPVQWGVIVLPCAFILISNVSNIASMPPMQRDLYPEHTVDTILNGAFPGPILAEFGQGGYLMHRLADEKGDVHWPVAIDGRTNILSADEMEAYMDMVQGIDDWRSFIRAYNPGTIMWPSKSPLVSLLRESSQWREIIDGDMSEEGMSVFVAQNIPSTNSVPN